jgi:uroporphyrinogen III methyltransferase/synthase
MIPDDSIVQNKRGIVHLVGAGPGDPMLLTRKALALLKEADVVAYDDLVHPSLLRLAKSEAILLPVGYRGLRDEALTQAVLDPDVISYAKAGSAVVRLKTGDPLVLGRGGEEALALKALDIPFTIVPGITAALGAAASAGIPLTHRSLSGGFRLMTGHRMSDLEDSLDGTDGVTGTNKFSGADHTLVVYMVRKHLARLVDDLIARGWRADTPAAFVINATTPAQKILSTSLENLPNLVAREEDSGPGLALIGPTVALHRELWTSEGQGPLSGHRVLVARARPGVSKVARALRERGADVIETPLMVPRSLIDFSATDAALRDIGRWDILAFGCDESVRWFFRHLGRLGLDIRDLPRRPAMAVGESAVRTLGRFGMRAEMPMGGACREALNQWSRELQGKSILLLGHDGGRPQLLRDLHQHGSSVHQLAVYTLDPVGTRIVAPKPSVIVVPSSSAGRHIFTGDLGFDPRTVPVVAIGPESERAVRELGAKHVYVTSRDDLRELVDLTTEVVSGLPLSEDIWAVKMDRGGAVGLSRAGQSSVGAPAGGSILGAGRESSREGINGMLSLEEGP